MIAHDFSCSELYLKFSFGILWMVLETKESCAVVCSVTVSTGLEVYVSIYVNYHVSAVHGF